MFSLEVELGLHIFYLRFHSKKTLNDFCGDMVLSTFSIVKKQLFIIKPKEKSEKSIRWPCPWKKFHRYLSSAFSVGLA